MALSFFKKKIIALLIVKIKIKMVMIILFEYLCYDQILIK